VGKKFAKKEVRWFVGLGTRLGETFHKDNILSFKVTKITTIKIINFNILLFSRLANNWGSKPIALN